MRIGSLCTGYGGLDLAVENHYGASLAWYSEFDKNASKIFARHYPGVTNYGDLKAINWHDLEPVDIITAGYPCQPFSTAGKREGTNDPRHLFPYIAEAISVLRPRYVVLENVRGHLSLGFDEVLRTLTEIGYDAKWQIVRAADAGAPHRRERLFIVAYADSSTREKLQRTDRNVRNEAAEVSGRNLQGESRQESRDGSKDTGNYDAEYSDADSFGLLGTEPRQKRNQGESQLRSRQLGAFNWRQYAESITKWERITQRIAPHPTVDNKLNPVFVEWLMGLPEGWVTSTEISYSAQLKALGNGVVPQQAALALQLLESINYEH